MQISLRMKSTGRLLFPGFVAAVLLALVLPVAQARIIADLPSVELCADPTANQTLEEDDGCLAILKELAGYDAEMSARVDVKKAAAADATTSHMFVSNMILADGTSDGNALSSEGTRSWVSELYEGLGAQYSEYHADDGTEVGAALAGYLTINATEVFTTFEATALHQGRVLWHFRHMGLYEHHWIVEQMPNYEGYRVLQSFDTGYSLYAWLNGCLPEAMLATGEIKNLLTSPDSIYMYFLEKLYVTNPDYVLDVTDPDGAVGALADDFVVFAPYVQWILSTSEDTIMAYFEAAWSWLGKGQVQTKEEFLNYAIKLSTITDYMYTMDGSTELVTQEMWELWIELYGYPNPFLFPGTPFKAISFIMDIFGYEGIGAYELQVLPVVMDGDEILSNYMCQASRENLMIGLGTRSPIA